MTRARMEPPETRRTAGIVLAAGLPPYDVSPCEPGGPPRLLVTSCASCSSAPRSLCRCEDCCATRARRWKRASCSPSPSGCWPATCRTRTSCTSTVPAACGRSPACSRCSATRSPPSVCSASCSTPASSSASTPSPGPGAAASPPPARSWPSSSSSAPSGSPRWPGTGRWRSACAAWPSASPGAGGPRPGRPGRPIGGCSAPACWPAWPCSSGRTSWWRCRWATAPWRGGSAVTGSSGSSGAASPPSRSTSCTWPEPGSATPSRACSSSRCSGSAAAAPCPSRPRGTVRRLPPEGGRGA